MDLDFQQEQAITKYRSFIVPLLHARSRNVSPGSPDLPPWEDVVVSRETMLNCFLAGNPKLEPFREQLAGVFPSLDVFPLDKERWEAVSSKS